MTKQKNRILVAMILILNLALAVFSGILLSPKKSVMADIDSAISIRKVTTYNNDSNAVIWKDNLVYTYLEQFDFNNGDFIMLNNANQENISANTLSKEQLLIIFNCGDAIIQNQDIDENQGNITFENFITSKDLPTLTNENSEPSSSDIGFYNVLPNPKPEDNSIESYAMLNVSAKLNGRTIDTGNNIATEIDSNKYFYQFLDLTNLKYLNTDNTTEDVINPEGFYEYTFTYRKKQNNITYGSVTSTVNFYLINENSYINKNYDESSSVDLRVNLYSEGEIPASLVNSEYQVDNLNPKVVFEYLPKNISYQAYNLIKQSATKNADTNEITITPAHFELADYLDGATSYYYLSSLNGEEKQNYAYSVYNSFNKNSENLNQFVEPRLYNTERLDRLAFNGTDNSKTNYTSLNEINYFNYNKGITGYNNELVADSSGKYPTYSYDASKYNLSYEIDLSGNKTSVTTSFVLTNSTNGILTIKTTKNGVVTSVTNNIAYNNELKGFIVNLEFKELGYYTFNLNYCYTTLEKQVIAPNNNIKLDNWNILGTTELYYYGYELYHTLYNTTNNTTSESKFKSDTFEYTDEVSEETVTGIYTDITTENTLQNETINYVSDLQNLQSQKSLVANVPYLCTTNQAPVLFKYYATTKLNEFNQSESFYLYYSDYLSYKNWQTGQSTQKPDITESGRVLNSTKFTKNGVYEVFMKYDLTSYKTLDANGTDYNGNDLTHLQAFVFQIANREPTLTLNAVDNQQDNPTLFYSNDWTNRNVRLTWSPQTIFDVTPKITILKQGFTSTSYEDVTTRIGVDYINNVVLAQEDGHYAMSIAYGPNLSTKEVIDFSIDKTNISDISVYKVRKDVNSNNKYIESQDLSNSINTTSINHAFILEWGAKQIQNQTYYSFSGTKISGAKINCTYSFIPLLEDLSFDSANETNKLSYVLNGQVSNGLLDLTKNLTMYSKYMFNDITNNINYNNRIKSFDFSNGGYGLTGSNSNAILNQAGIYIFNFEDEAGNKASKVVFLDNSSPVTLLQINGETYNDGSQDLPVYKLSTILDNVASRDTTVIWGKNKAIKMSTTIIGELNTLFSSSTLFLNNSTDIQAKTTLIGADNYLSLPINSVIVKNQKNAVLANISTEQYHVFKILEQKENGIRKWDTGDFIYRINVTDEAYTIDSDLNENIASYNNKSFMQLELNSDNSLLQAWTMGTYTKNYTGLDANSSQAKRLYTGRASNRQQLFVDWKENAGVYDITKLVYDFYPLTFELTYLDTNGKLCINTNYPYSNEPYLSNVDLLEDAIVSSISTSNVKLMSLNLLNGESSSYYGNQITTAGKYVITREYLNPLSATDNSGDTQIRNYVFYIDRNSLIGEVDGGMLLGEDISIIMGTDGTEFSGSDFLLDSTSASKLTTNKLPATVKVGATKYLNYTEMSKLYTLYLVGKAIQDKGLQGFDTYSTTLVQDSNTLFNRLFVDNATSTDQNNILRAFSLSFNIELTKTNSSTSSILEGNVISDKTLGTNQEIIDGLEPILASNVDANSTTTLFELFKKINTTQDGTYKVTIKDCSGYEAEIDGRFVDNEDPVKYIFKYEISNSKPLGSFIKVLDSREEVYIYGDSVNDARIKFVWSIPKDEYLAQIDWQDLTVTQVLPSGERTLVYGKDLKSTSYYYGKIVLTALPENSLKEWDYELDFTNFYTDNVLNCLDAKYIVNIHYIGNESDYISSDSTGTELINFYSNQLEIWLDFTAPEHNFNLLIDDDKFLTEDMITTFNNYATSSTTGTANVNFENYAFTIDEAFAFEDATNEGFWHTKNDTYTIYYRKYDKYNGYGQNEQSLIPEDDRYDDLTKVPTRYRFNENLQLKDETTGQYVNLYNSFSRKSATNTNSFYEQVRGKMENIYSGDELDFYSHGYFEIIEIDEAGNHRIYTVYIPYDNEELRVDYTINSVVNNENVDRQYIKDLGLNEEFNINNVKLSLNNITLINSQSTTNPIYCYPTPLIRFTVKNMKRSNSDVDFYATSTGDGSLLTFSEALEQINAIICEANHDTVNGSYWQIIIQSSLLQKQIIHFRTPGKELLLTFTDTVSGFTVKLPTWLESDSTFLTSFKIYKTQIINGTTTQTPVTQDSQFINISSQINMNQLYVYTFISSNGGEYLFEFIDNFSRVSRAIKLVGIKDEVSIVYSGKYITENDTTFTSDIVTITYQTNLYALKIYIFDNVSATFKETNEFDNIVANGNGIKTFRLFNQVNNNELVENIQLKYRVVITKSTGSKIERIIRYYPHLADVYLQDSTGTDLKISGTGSVTDKSIYVDYNEDQYKFRTYISATRTITNTNGTTTVLELGKIVRGACFSETGKYVLTVYNDLGTLKTIEFTIKDIISAFFSVTAKIDVNTNKYIYPSPVKYTGDSGEYDQYFTVYDYDIELNTAKKLSKEEDLLKRETTSLYTKYVWRIWQPDPDNISNTIENGYEKYIVVYKMNKTSAFLGSNNLFIVNNNPATFAQSKEVSPVVPILIDKCYNAVPGNILTMKVYYNSILVKTLVGTGNEEQFGLSVEDCGVYDIYISDLAGNTQRFGTNSFYRLILLNNIIFNINDKEPVQNSIFNSSVKLTLLQLSQYDDPRIIIEAFLNGTKITTKVTNNSCIFTEYGVYNVNLTGYVNDTEITTTFLFTILNENVTRTAFEYIGNSGYEVTKIVIDGFDSTDIIRKQIGIEHINKLALSALDGGIGGFGHYEITVVAKYTTQKPTQTFTFNTWLNYDENVLIICNIKPGETSTKPITIQINRKQIYEKIGECTIKLNGEDWLTVTETNSLENKVETFVSEANGKINIQLITDNDNTVLSFTVTKNPPLNTWALIIIVLASAAAAVLIIIFVKLRKGMRVK